AKAARARYGSETDVHAEIDAKKGELRLSRPMLVGEIVENSSNQISLADTQRANPGAQVGDTIADTLPPLEYGRIAAQSAKQGIVQKVAEAERDRERRGRGGSWRGRRRTGSTRNSRTASATSSTASSSASNMAA